MKLFLKYSYKFIAKIHLNKMYPILGLVTATSNIFHYKTFFLKRGYKFIAKY